ncbi:GGDEF domain-containing protein [Kordiimonas lipolytica]|uniref:diguanylate cyclase n=1 Tax=Kordiimonas lipolytica TaxID=1662421 RepID=A0ABV8U9V9_9PROT|nr:GGDEF domain-containing protein [Kordiimonas lipolytica]
MALDLSSLLLVTVLILAVSTCVLVAHWIANFSFAGLGRLAIGMAMATAGVFVLTLAAGPERSLAILLGDLLILTGHLWFWFGIADYWKERSRRLTYLAGAIMVFAIVILVNNLLQGGTQENRAALYSFFAAVFSLGAALSVVQALGGRVGLYKGIIKRKTIGASVVAGVFLAHGGFNVYRGISIMAMETPKAYFDDTAIATLTQIEGMVFALALAVSLIVSTAERVQADLRIQAMMDPLTQALNRRAFMTVIKTVLARSRRLSEPVSLIMMDIDKFKRINLKHGHLVGDAILSQFAEGVMEGRRAQDVFCRFGGEEFVLLLPGTAEEGAELVAHRVRDAVTGYPFQHGNKDISLTVSFGVTTARGDDLLPDSILDAAYKALREAQKEGRNQIEVSGSAGAVKPAQSA